MPRAGNIVNLNEHFSTPQHLNTATPQHLNTSTPQHLNTSTLNTQRLNTDAGMNSALPRPQRPTPSARFFCRTFMTGPPEIDGALIKPLKRFQDARGWLTELFR